MYNAQCLHTEWDECSRGVADCGINAVCSDTPDSYNCSCAAGYQGDGYTCEGRHWVYYHNI